MNLFSEVSKVAKSRAVEMDDGMNNPAQDQKLAPEDDLPDTGIPRDVPEKKDDFVPPENPGDLASQYDFDDESDEVEALGAQGGDVADESIPAAENSGVAAEDQVARAIAMGLKAEEIREFSQLGDLGKILDSLEKVQWKPSTTETPPLGEVSDDAGSIDDFKIELDENFFDPELTEELNNQIKSKLGPVIKRLNEDVTTLKTALENERRVAFEREFDGMIEALDDSYAALLGKQPGREMDPHSPQMQNRIRVLQAMANLGKTQPGADTAELFSQALAVVFKDQMKQIAAHELRSSLQKRQGQILGRPENRKRTLPPRQKAVQSVAKFLADEGYNLAEEAFDEEEFS
ncbi:MAG TPA: hypothetical protein PLX83_19260 [bacterium]|nr:hypothetical protein [bacterium]